MFRRVVRGTLWVQIGVAAFLIVTGWMVMRDVVAAPPESFQAAHPSDSDHPEGGAIDEPYSESPSERRKHLRQYVASLQQAQGGPHAPGVVARLNKVLKGLDPQTFLSEALLSTCPISHALTKAHVAACDAAAQSEGLSWGSFQDRLRGELRLDDAQYVARMATLKEQDPAVYEVQHGFLKRFAVSAEEWPRVYSQVVSRYAMDVFGIRVRQPYHPSQRGMSFTERRWLDCSWDSITVVHRHLWSKLGWTQALWDIEESATVTAETDKAFAQLQPLQQVAAWCLGYTPVSW